ncbi:MAG: polysaccharide deacetylase family protein, partial [Candidatus Helarchaeota archaeon]
MKSALVLTFHGLGNPFYSTEEARCLAEAQYNVSEKHFLQVVEKFSPMLCCKVSDFVNESKGDWRILTFDDGLISDYEFAFPLLKANGLRATFFITAENVGKAGYANFNQLRIMAEAGMEIA